MKALRWIGIALITVFAWWAIAMLIDDSFHFEGRWTDVVISTVIVAVGYWFCATGRLAWLFRKVR